MLVLVAPFEALRPVVEVAGQSLSTVEAALLAAFGAWTVALVSTRTLPAWRTALTLPWLVVLATMLAAALAAPSHQGNALNMAGRMSLAFGSVFARRQRHPHGCQAPRGARGHRVCRRGRRRACPARVLRRRRRSELSFDVPPMGRACRLSGPRRWAAPVSDHRVHVSRDRLRVCPRVDVDGDGRTAPHRGRNLSRRRGGHRSGDRLHLHARRPDQPSPRRWRSSRGCATAAAASIAASPHSRWSPSCSRSNSCRRGRPSRFGSGSPRETTDAWFRADILGPVELNLSTGSRSSVPVRLRNTGGATLDSSAPQPFQLSYHWLAAERRHRRQLGRRAHAVPRRVGPGSTIALDAFVEAPPEPGEYRLMWDVEHGTGCGSAPSPARRVSMSRVVVIGAAGGHGARRSIQRRCRRLSCGPAAACCGVRPSACWRTTRCSASVPTTSGCATADPRACRRSIARMHSNNMYLEMLVGGGVVGGAAFAWLCWVVATRTGRRPARLARDAARAGDGRDRRGGGSRSRLHGLVDSFLSFTPTYIALRRDARLCTSASLALHRTHAHRI